MPRFGPFIHQVYIADGFADDCDEMIHRCLREEKLDYHVFCKIWKDMNMGCLYEGRNLGAEVAELSEEVINVGKHFMLKDISNFEESAVGVFIVYALLELQPYKGFAHLRITPEDLPAINRIERVARREKRYDVLYALGSILIKGPVEYHAVEREYGMDLPVRKYLEGFTTIDKLGVRPKGVIRRQNEELDLLREIQILSDRYTQCKMLISAKAKYDRSLQYINPHFAKEMEAALMKLVTGVHEDKYGVSIECDDGDKISNSRRAIKDKAMKHEVNPVRHRVNLEDRKPSTSTNDRPNKEDTKPSPKKTTKDVSKKKDKRSERKRRIPISPRAIKRNRHIQLKQDAEQNTQNDESEINQTAVAKESNEIVESVELSEKIKETAIDTKKKKKGKKTVKDDKGNEQEIDDAKNVIENNEGNKQIRKGKKNVSKHEKEKKQVTIEQTNTIENEEDSEQELDIEIDTLPVLIRTEEHGKLFEIEIIDQQVPSKPVESKPKPRRYKKKETALQKISSMPGITIEKIVGPKVIEPVASTSSANELATITETNEGSNKKEGKTGKSVQNKSGVGILTHKFLERRECKRVHIKSKFKRLGMLPVANFEGSKEIVPDVVASEADEKDSNDDSQGNVGLKQIDD